LRPELEELDVAHGEAGVGEPQQRLARHRRPGCHRVLVLAVGDGLDPDADEVEAGLGRGDDELRRAEGQQGEVRDPERHVPRIPRRLCGVQYRIYQ
jgi:hypothetical protein